MPRTITDPLAHQADRHVFVYGTLRRWQQRDINFLQPAPVFVGTGKINGTLFDLGTYPGVRLGGTFWVQGEIYRICSQLELKLDEIESIWPQDTGEYAKCDVLVQCEGTSLTCLVYEAAATHTQGKRQIVSGDWTFQSLKVQ